MVLTITKNERHHAPHAFYHLQKQLYTNSVTCVSYFFKETKKGSRIDGCNTYIISSFLSITF